MNAPNVLEMPAVWWAECRVGSAPMRVIQKSKKKRGHGKCNFLNDNENVIPKETALAQHLLYFDTLLINICMA